MPSTVTFQQNFPAGCPSASEPYSEAGLTFTNNVGNRWASPFVNRFVGTYGSPSKLIVTPAGGGLFTFLSLQVCNSNTAIPAQTTVFTGTRADGSTVSALFTTTEGSTAPQTFASNDFNDLESLVVSLGFVGFDTLVFEAPQTRTVTFDQGFPAGCPSSPTPYSEDGLTFTNSIGNQWASPFVNNFVGSYGYPCTLNVTPDGGGTFDFKSLQVCNPNNAIPAQTVTFTGTQPGGHKVSASFTTPGYSTAPQTFAPPGFDRLTSLEVSLGFVAFDDLVFVA